MNEQRASVDSLTQGDTSSRDWSTELSRELLGETNAPHSSAIQTSTTSKIANLPTSAQPHSRTRTPRPRQLLRAVSLTALMLGAGAVAWVTAGWPAPQPAPAPASGRLTIDTRPVGASIAIDGVPKGIAPMTIALAAGPHRIEVRQGDEFREIPLTVSAGEHFSQYVEFPVPPETGRLQIDTDPQGARVLVDQELRGVSPIVVHNLKAGPHVVALQSDVGSVERPVTVDAGATSSVFVPLVSKGAPLSGWMAITTPVELQLFEAGRLIGSTQTERVMMSAGRHDVELVNETFGYRAVRPVAVLPGKTTTIPIDLPEGTLHINATPWAEVWIDGKPLGETPLGNLSVPIGPHEVVFRHPQLAQQRHGVNVTLLAPTRLSVNLGK